jgi:anti-sigma B factor antagonist
VTIQANSRQVDGVTVVDLSGSITVDGGSQQFRDTVKSLLVQGRTKVLLNLGQIEKIDSDGLGELISAYTNLRQAGGELKMFNLSHEVHDLLQITKLCTVFDIQEDEASAIAAFEADRGAVAQ